MKTAVKTETKHVPGPWDFHLGRGAEPRFHVQAAGGYQIASTTAINNHPAAADENATRVANARLIAAAPELLSAMQAVEKRLTECARAFYGSGKASALRAAFDGWRDDIDAARAAIAKATGE